MAPFSIKQSMSPSPGASQLRANARTSRACRLRSLRRVGVDVATSKATIDRVSRIARLQRGSAFRELPIASREKNTRVFVERGI